MSTNTSEYSRL